MSSSDQEQISNLIIKLYLSKDHIRRFTAVPSSSLEDVKAKVVEFYTELGQQISTDNLDLQYCDSDNEWAILRSEDDWYCCKAICSPNIKIRQASMWMKAVYNYKTNQQALVQKFNKEKKQLVTKGQELCSQVNQELKKLGSSEDVKKFEKAVQDFCANVVDSLTPLLNNAADATSDLFGSVEEAFRGKQSESALIRVTEHNEDREVDQEEEKAFQQAASSQQEVEQPQEQQQQQPIVKNEENVIERSGFIWVNPTNNNSVPVVEPKAEEAPAVVEPVQQEPVQEPVVEQPPVQQVVAEEPVPVVAQQEELVVESPFAEQLKMLEVMGFTDVPKNLQLLEKHNGNLALVVDELL